MNSKPQNKKNAGDNCSTNRNFEQLFKKSKKNVNRNKNKLFDEILIKSSEEKTKTFLKIKNIFNCLNEEYLENTQKSIKNFIIFYSGIGSAIKSKKYSGKILNYSVGNFIYFSGQFT